MANNIREIRKQRGLSMEQLGSLVGAHFTTIAKLERSQRGLSSELLFKIAAALKVDPKELVTDAGPQPRMVPLLGTIAAGSWREAINEPEGYVLAPSGGPNVFGLRPQGNSMDLVLMDGAYVLIDPDETELREGLIFAVRNEGGDATLKMYRADPPRLEPCSSDPVHKAIVFGREPFTVIGRVIWQGKDM